MPVMGPGPDDSNDDGELEDDIGSDCEYITEEKH